MYAACGPCCALHGAGLDDLGGQKGRWPVFAGDDSPSVPMLWWVG